MSQKDTEYLVGGFRFQTAEEAEIARQEKQRITLLEVKLDYDNIASIAMLYEKAVRNQVFVTPIGMTFLSKLQKILVEHDRPEGLLAIPVEHVKKAEQDSAPAEQPLEENEIESVSKEDEELSKEEPLAEYEHERGTVRLSILVDDLEKQLAKKDKQINRIMRRMKKSILLNFVLVGVVVLLFVIALTGENANALNYKRVLTDRYASWEEELKQREEAVREKEKELQIEEWEKEIP